MSTPDETRETLRNMTLFKEFTEEEIEVFVSLMDPERYADEALIVRQDDAGDCMYILLSGRAKVIHHRAGHNIDLAVLKAGDFFGEISLVDEGPRSADVAALEECTLLKITHPALSALAGVYPMAAFKLLIGIGRIMVDRLRRGNQRYIDSLLFPIAGKD